jgi:microcystin-dependent protein
MDPFVAEIRMFPFNFAPRGWAFCDGQLLPLSQNTALFSLVGTYYGGDGKSNFALPDLQGRSAKHPGLGPGLSEHVLGEEAGEEFVTLLQTEIPAHAHRFGGAYDGSAVDPGTGDPIPGDSGDPTGCVWSKAPAGRNGAIQLYAATATGAVNPDCMSITGGSQPHNNLQPYLTLNFCIALQGVFPPRT